MQLGWKSGLQRQGRLAAAPNHEQRFSAPWKARWRPGNPSWRIRTPSANWETRQCALGAARLTSLPAYWGDGWVATHAGLDLAHRGA